MNTQIKLPASELKQILPGFKQIIGKSSLPILGCLRITSHRNGSVSLQATNLEDFVTYIIQSECKGKPLDLLIPFADLFKITKGCSLQDIVSLGIQNEVTTISYPVGSTFLEQKVETFDLDKWPVFPVIQQNSTSVGDEFKAALKTALDCSSDDSTRLILNSAFVDVSDPKAHYVVGTNGQHMFSANSFCFNLKESIVIPHRAFVTWKGFIENGDWNISMQASQKENESGWIQIQSDRWTLITRQIEGNYPNWRSPIPASDKRQTTIQLSPESVEALLSAIPKMPGEDTPTKGVGLEFVPNDSLILKGKSKSGEYEASIPIKGATIQGKAGVVHCNRTYLLKALKLGLAEIEVFDPESPLIVRSGGKRMIIAPVCVEDQPVRTTIQTNPSPVQKTPSSTEPEQPFQEENQTMKTVNRIEQIDSNTEASNGETTGTKESSVFRQALDKVETIKETLKSVVTDLNDLMKLLSQAQREKRTTEKEIESIRDTLQSLQRIRI